MRMFTHRPLRNLAMGLVLALALTEPGHSQTTNSVSGSITVVQPVLEVTKNSDLAFGSVVRPTSGSGTITIDGNTGTVTTSNLVRIGTSATRASFSITGQANANIQVTAPSTITLTRTGGAETLSIAVTSTMGGGQISSGGTASFYLGGQATLQSTTVPGGYTGVFNVTVAYN